MSVAISGGLEDVEPTYFLSMPSRLCPVLTALVAGLVTGCGGEDEPTSRPDLPSRTVQEMPTGTVGKHTSAAATNPDSSCPRTDGGRKAPNVAITLGDGPAYPVLGMSAPPPAREGVVTLDSDLHRRGAYLHKTLWAVSPSASGDLIVRARRRGSHEPVRFYYGSRVPDDHQELRLPAPEGEWRYAVTDTMLPGPGCFMFEVTGGGVRERIVFEVVR